MTTIFRKVFHWLHLYLGIAGAIVLIVICGTGTLLVFEEEVAEAMDRSDYYAPPTNQAALPLEQIVDSVQKQQQVVVKGFYVYPDSLRHLQMTVVNIADDGPNWLKQRKGRAMTVNRFTGQMVEPAGKWHDFFHSVMELHRWLLTDRTVGKPITGAATIIFVVVAITGIVIYFPPKFKAWFKRRYLLPPVKAKNRKGTWRILHLSLGYYALIPLLIMSLSGLIWSYKWYYDGLERVLGAQLGKQRFDAPVPLAAEPDSTVQKTLPYRQLLSIADRELPYETKIYRIDLPRGENQTVMIRKKPDRLFALDASDKVQLNPYTGDVVEVDRFGEWPLNAKIAQLIRTLHVGSVFGVTSKIIYLLAALIGTSLPVTGLVMWIRRLRASRRKKVALD
ncbi:MAG: PepSY-associated TM helix domain-containing protein [Breznakibacter sp.]